MTLSALLIVDGLGLSGKTKALADLAVGLDKRRYQPTVVCFGKEDSPLVEILDRASVPLVEVRVDDRLSVRNFARVFEIVRRLRPDIVHCYNPRTMLYGGTAARLLKIRATVGSLSAFACTVPDREYEFLPQRLITTSKRNRWRNKAVGGLMQRLAVVSTTLGERFCRYNGIPKDKLRVVPYGVALEAEPEGGGRRSMARARLRAELGVDDHHLLVASVGRLVEQKDYPTQIRGFATAAGADDRLRMVLIGDGPLRADLESLVRECGVGDRVTFLGYRSDVGDWLQAVDIFALTSKFEPFGVALLEAKAAGLPIVSTSVNEIPEILSDGQSGILFERSSAEGFGAALLRLARDRQLRESLARRAYAEARERHSIGAMIASYQDLYEEVYAAAHAQGIPRAEAS
jgi:glycosyltransferase involved in cell wall biosynthesis